MKSTVVLRSARMRLGSMAPGSWAAGAVGAVVAVAAAAVAGAGAGAARAAAAAVAGAGAGAASAELAPTPVMAHAASAAAARDLVNGKALVRMGENSLDMSCGCGCE
ncbi:MAG: hypothetical protein E6Q90_14615 [Actinobacteria bacterium]|nr:MAG: hypothetical protein E6Q90_14615 [Actinomycetota bacterium]